MIVVKISKICKWTYFLQTAAKWNKTDIVPSLKRSSVEQSKQTSIENGSDTVVNRVKIHAPTQILTVLYSVLWIDVY